MASEERKFTKQEVGALVRRAAELQGSREPDISAEQLTLADLETLTEETGVETQYLHQALAEIDAEAREGAEPTLGRVTLERTLPVTPDLNAFDDVVAELRHRFDHVGPDPGGRSGTRIIRGPNSVEWRNTNTKGDETRVLIQGSGDQTRLLLSRTAMPSCSATTALFGAPILFAGLGLAAFESGAAALLGALIGLAIGFAWVRHESRMNQDDSRQMLNDLVNDIEARLRAATTE